MVLFHIDIEHLSIMFYDSIINFPSSHIHKGFHGSCLKKVLGQTMPMQIEFPELEEEQKLILEPKKVKDRHYIYL